MGELIEFIKENYASIFSLTIIIFTILIIYNMLGIHTDTPDDDKVDKIVTIEALINKYELPNLSFNQDNYKIGGSDANKLTTISFNKNSYCNNNISSPDKLDKYCRLHTSKDDCASNNCCGWLNKLKCVAGNRSGPIFHGTQQRPLTIEYYDYMGKTIRAGN